MCLVEVEKSAKPVASCAMPVMPGMRVSFLRIIISALTGFFRYIPTQRWSRKPGKELWNFCWPTTLSIGISACPSLPCIFTQCSPICDQGGECDLQDQAMIFGSDRGRFYETKSASSAKKSCLTVL